MDGTDRLLEAIERVEAKVDAGEHRFAAIEAEQTNQRKALQTLTDEVATHRKLISEQAESLTAVAKASAVASEIAAKALRNATDGKDEVAKMVESAIAIQNRQIAGIVATQLAPLVKRLSDLEAGDAKRGEALVKLEPVLKQLASWQSSPWFKAGLFFGGALVALLAKYFVH